MTNAEKSILYALSKGEIVRRMDGRMGETFVDLEALEDLITKNLVEVYKLNGFDFVKGK